MMTLVDFIDLGATASGLVVGLLVGIAADPIRQWLLRAKLTARFSVDEHHVRDTPAVFSTADRRGRAWFTRISVKNTSRFTARACRPYLTKIEAAEADGAFSTVFADTLPLPWAYVKFQPVDLPQGVSFYFDVVYTFPGCRHPIPETDPKPLIFPEILSPQRRYRFSTLVSGEGTAPVQAVIELQWQGDGSAKPTVQMIQSS